jgi:hypothetical protein
MNEIKLSKEINLDKPILQLGRYCRSLINYIDPI